MPLLESIRARLSAGGYFGFQLIGGGLAILVAGWTFGEIAEHVVRGAPLTQLDAEIATWFHVNAIPRITDLMLFLSAINGVGAICVSGALFAIVLALRREWFWLLYLALALPGGFLLNMLTKAAFQRQRPSFDDPLVTLSSYSFPSGHTMGATLFYGTLAAFLVPRVRTRVARLAIVCAAIMMIVLVASSRVYLGAHYLSDVLAAVAEGVAWLALCLIAVATLRRRRLAQAARSA